MKVWGRRQKQLLAADAACCILTNKTRAKAFLSFPKSKDWSVSQLLAPVPWSWIGRLGWRAQGTY